MKKIFFLSIVGFLVLLELFLRFYWGLCDTVIMKESSKYEYIAAPNQNVYRFRNHIFYNNFSMRSESLRKDSRKILGLGDSVINGGVLTDQDSLATTILSKRLSESIGEDIQVLNISAGSWGPDNCNAYLEENGCFDAEIIVLVVSSHDVHDIMNFSPVVGVVNYFPTRKPHFAIMELWSRYLWPRVKSVFMTKENQKIQFEKDHGIKKDGIGFNPGFFQLKHKADSLGIPLVMYLHAEISEIEANKYNDQGEEIINFAENNDIFLIKDLDFGFDKSDYRNRDNIHLSNKGQAKMAELLFPILLDLMKN